MALDFLSGASSFATGIGGLLNAFGIGKPKMNYGPTPSERQANSLFQALLDPNNSLVKQNTDINMQKGMQDMLMQLKLFQMQNARGQARGLQPALFSPERSDETLNYLLTRGQPAIAEKARNQATGDIRSTANSLMSFVPDERAQIVARNNNSMTNASNLQAQGGYGGMVNRFGGGLQDLLKILMPQQSYTNYSHEFGPPQQNEYGPWQ